MAKKEPAISRETVEITGIIEKQRTIRWVAVTAGVAFCLNSIADAVVEITSRSEPPWLTLALVVFGASGVGAAPGLAALSWVRQFIKKQMLRIAELQKTVDPARESSGLEKDGTLPND